MEHSFYVDSAVQIFNSLPSMRFDGQVSMENMSRSVLWHVPNDWLEVCLGKILPAFRMTSFFGADIPAIGKLPKSLPVVSTHQVSHVCHEMCRFLLMTTAFLPSIILEF